MEKYLMQMVMGCIGAVGFAVLFNVRRSNLWIIAAASALSWMGYAACMLCNTGVFWAFFCGTAVAALISEILARIVRVPVLMLLVPILIPLIPGGDLYHMMSNMVRGQEEQMIHYGRLLLKEAGAIALGIICVASFMSILMGLKQRKTH
jgi:uncharacterized membrane protein YjjB (DUF3815 family)